MVWGAIGAIGGALIGAKSAKADRNAQRYSDELNARGYTDARDYIKRGYKGGEDALNDALSKGYYGGNTYAGLNDRQRFGLDSQYNFGKSNFGAGNNMMNTASGFSGNYADLYNRANATNTNNAARDLYNDAAGNDMYSGQANDIYNRATGGFYDQEARDLYNAAGQDSMGNAQNYALNNSRPLIDAAMRGANRNLNEVQLPGLNISASGTGNTNNSRAGVTEAVLRDRNSELEASTTAQINDSLMGRSLSQGNQDFSNRMNALGGMKSGSMNQLNAMRGGLSDLRSGDQSRFNNMYTGFGAMNSANNNTFNNMMAANRGLAATYGIGMDTANSGITGMLGSGSADQIDAQNRLDADRQRFEGDRDFASNQYGNFMSGILGRAPMSPPGQNPNYNNPTMGGLTGAMAGAGFGNKYGQQISNFFGGFGSQPQRAGASYFPGGNNDMYDPLF
jgi:hypothetical protein